MPKEDFEKYAGPIEEFVSKIILSRTRAKYPFDKTIEMRSRKNWHEDHALKCDFFLRRNGKDWIAFDAKSPKGIKTKIDWDNHWICPFDTNGNKRDVSLEVKIENPDVQDRFIAFCEKDSIVLVSSTALAKWLMDNVYPDFHGWNDDREGFKELIAESNVPLQKFQVIKETNSKKEKLLCTITAEELWKIGYKIQLNEEELEQWCYVLDRLT